MDAEFGEEDEGEEEDAPSEKEIEAELAAIGEEIAASFDEITAEEIVEFYTFAIYGDKLTLSDHDDNETVWDRIPLESAVAARSWGQIKRLSR